MELSPNLHAMVAEVARSRAGAAAVLAPGRPALSYGQLAAQVRAVGHRLAASGLGHRHRVAIVLPNGAELAVAMLAAATYVICAPLDPASSEAEFRASLERLRIDLVIVPVNGARSARDAANALSIACIEAMWDDAMPAGAFELGGTTAMSVSPIPAGCDDVALLLQTSGTTSTPKRVPLTHANLCRSAASIASTLALDSNDRGLNVMPMFHVHGFVAGLLASLHAGGSVVCLPSLSPGRFVAWLRDFEPTWYSAVPAIHRLILRELECLPPGSLQHRLRFARSSSAPLPPALAASMEAALRVPVIEAYGMTEAAHQIASNPLPPAPRVAGSVGRAAGPDVAIMGASGALVPPGTPGEIVIRGPNVMRGYEVVAASTAASADGWFHTGDLGWLDAQGYLRISGRASEVINRGGEKVSPREVEEALLAHPAVLECAVFAVDHATLGEDVAAAVVVGADDVDADALRRTLFGRLSESKIPSRVVIVDALPKGSTGKISRVGMADRLRPWLKTSFVAPRSDSEREVAGWFADVIGVERVGANDNFFALGGDSLRGGQLLARVLARFDVTLPLATLFRLPTPAALVAEIERLRGGADDAALTPLLAGVESLSDEEAQSLLERLPSVDS